jgi:hypothetical protein
LRPDERIEFSELGGYLDLVRHINAHRYALSRQLGRAIERDEAVAGWYDSVYMPIVQVIRAQGALRRLPGRTEADLYRWIMDHRDALGEDLGTPAEPGHAASTYAEAFGRAGWAEAVAALLRGAPRQRGDR